MAKKKREHVLDLPADMVEEIFFNLPVKSLLRFSSVSKAWKSMISNYRFVKRYSRCERIFLINNTETYITSKSSSIAISSSSSTQTQAQVESVVCPFGKRTRLLTFCEELWLATDNKSLFLWNPSMRTYKKLRYPTLGPRRGKSPSLSSLSFAYGLGYDSLADDYKVLKIEVDPSLFTIVSMELYSLRSDSWRAISNFPRVSYLHSTAVVFAGGNLHWMSYDDNTDINIITCFNLSTEEFGEVAKPKYSLEIYLEAYSVMRGKFCLIPYYVDEKCDVWLMEDYGVAASWTKQFSLKLLGSLSGKWIVPLHFYENGDVLLAVNEVDFNFEIYVYKDDKTVPRRINGPIKITGIVNYVDSLVAPWSTRRSVAPWWRKLDWIRKLTTRKTLL